MSSERMSEVTETEEIEAQSLVRLRLITYNARLVDARKECGMSQMDMALAIGMRKDHISKIETLKVIPTDDEICKIASVLEKFPDYLFPEELLSAVAAGVFSRRKAELGTPEVISLTEAQHLRLTYDGETALIEEVSRTMLAEQLKEVLNTLAPRERRVLELRFGLKDGESRSLEDVGKEFDLTRERIRQIEAKAIRKLRHPSRSRRLKQYLQ